MKFYNSIGPNPKLVRMFAAEKGWELPETVEIDIMAGENRKDAYMEKNPGAQMPGLELDDGRFLAETIALCEYIEELQPEPSLIGSTAEERAETRMWVRRIDLNICENLANGFRFAEGLSLFKDRLHCIPQAADDLKAVVQEKLVWLEGLMDGKEFICGDRFTLADILLFAFLEFGASVGQPLDAKCERLQAWYARVAVRPSITS